MKMKKETCPTCEGHKNVIIAYGTQDHERSEGKCPHCNGEGFIRTLAENGEEFVMVTRKSYEQMRKEDTQYCSYIPVIS